MRINYLKMAAFGPFSGEEYIDFGSLNQKGLFLLTGPTGVGKTSIFDAICFALYGQTSGTESSTDKARSLYADEFTKTFVELSFVVNGHDYFIHREPTQLIKSKRSVIESKHNVIFTADGKDYTKVSEANKKIVEILGLSIEQFRQIVMIPQGEFVKLLNSPTSEKEIIFRRIFNTSNISKFQEILQARFQEKNKALKNKNDVIINRLNGVKIDSDFTANLKVENLSASLEYLYNANQENEKRIVNLRDEVKNLETEVLFLDEKYNSIKKTNEGIRAYRKSYSDSKQLDYSCYKEKKLKEDNYVLSKDINTLIKSNDVFLKDNIKSKNSMNDNTIMLNSLNQKKDEVLKEKEILLSKQSVLDSNKIEVNRLRQELSELDKKLRIENEVDNLSLRLKEKDNAINSYSQKIEAIDHNIEVDRQALKECEAFLDKEEAISDKLKQCEIAVRLMEEDRKLFKEKIDLKRTLESKNIEKIVAHKDFLDKESIANKYEKIFINNSAYYIASHLKEDEACPVCGSTFHPRLQNSLNSEVTEELVNEARMLQHKAQNVLSKYEIEIKNIMERIELLDKAIFDKGYSSYDEFINCLKDKMDTLDELKKQKNLITNTKKKSKDLSSAIEQSNRNKEAYQKIILTIQEEIKNITNEIYQKKEQIVGFIKRDRNELIKEIDELNQVIREFEAEVKKNQEEITEVEKRISSLTATNISLMEMIKDNDDKILTNQKKIDTLSSRLQGDYHDYLMSDNEYRELVNYLRSFESRKAAIDRMLVEFDQYKDKEEIDQIPFENELKEKRNKQIEINKEYGILLKEHQANVIIYNDANKLYKESQEDYKSLARLLAISNTAKGNNSNKLSFERYILSIYFDSCLAQANYIFRVLTNNRYDLVRREERSGNAQIGLDLDVIDYYTGKRRDVKTLSGGESFKAALSLALGLSDIIGQRSSGIEINMMFIDEGFGSLDSESLDVALNVLADLKSNGRTIGIISHVGELMKRIDSKIIIEGSSRGSKIKDIIC